MDWYPWYPAIYRADTMHLTAEQDGIYRRLIDHYMETRNLLPESMVALARITGVDVQCFEHAWSILKAYFKHEKGGGYRHIFCDNMLDVQDSRSRRRSETAKVAANKRWKNSDKNQDVKCYQHTNSNANAMLANATGQDRTVEDNKLSSRKTEFPDWLPMQDWKDYTVMRKKIKKPMTEAAVKQAISKLDDFRLAGHNPSVILKQSTFNSWQGLFEPKGYNYGSHQQKATYHERLNAAADKAVADILRDIEAEAGETLAIEGPDTTDV